MSPVFGGHFGRTARPNVALDHVKAFHGCTEHPDTHTQAHCRQWGAENAEPENARDQKRTIAQNAGGNAGLENAEPEKSKTG